MPSTHYIDTGSGPPIVLVHGFPLDGRIWDDVVPLLAKTHRVIVPDLRGFGRSAPTATMSMESLAGELVELLGRIEVDRAAFAGLSMGGYVIQALVRGWPDRVERLVFVDTRANADDEAGRAGRDKMIALVREKGTVGIVDQMLPKMLHPDAYAQRPQVVERQRSIMMDCPPKTIEQACAAMRDRRDFTGELARLPCPLTIIVGEKDAIAPVEVARAMHAAAGPKSKLHVIPGAGHMAPLEQPEATAAVIALC